MREYNLKNEIVEFIKDANPTALDLLEYFKNSDSYELRTCLTELEDEGILLRAEWKLKNA